MVERCIAEFELSVCLHTPDAPVDQTLPRQKRLRWFHTVESAVLEGNGGLAL